MISVAHFGIINLSHLIDSCKWDGRMLRTNQKMTKTLLLVAKVYWTILTFFTFWGTPVSETIQPTQSMDHTSLLDCIRLKTWRKMLSYIKQKWRNLEHPFRQIPSNLSLIIYIYIFSFLLCVQYFLKVSRSEQSLKMKKESTSGLLGLFPMGGKKKKKMKLTKNNNYIRGTKITLAAATKLQTVLCCSCP